MALVSVKMAAKELGCSASMLYSLIRQRRIPYVAIGDRRLVSVEKIIAALEIPAESAERPSVVRTDACKKRHAIP
jgi:excisionase family DNA binding protein